MDATLGLMSRFVEDVRRAISRGDLPQCFRPDDVRQACPGWADHTYGVFLPKHRRGNPGGYTEYFLHAHAAERLDEWLTRACRPRHGNTPSGRKGLFANPNTACKLRNRFTLEVLCPAFGLDEISADNSGYRASG